MNDQEMDLLRRMAIQAGSVAFLFIAAVWIVYFDDGRWPAVVLSIAAVCGFARYWFLIAMPDSHHNAMELDWNKAGCLLQPFVGMCARFIFVVPYFPWRSAGAIVVALAMQNTRGPGFVFPCVALGMSCLDFGLSTYAYMRH